MLYHNPGFINFYLFSFSFEREQQDRDLHVLIQSPNDPSSWTESGFNQGPKLSRCPTEGRDLSILTIICWVQGCALARRWIGSGEARFNPSTPVWWGCRTPGRVHIQKPQWGLLSLLLCVLIENVKITSFSISEISSFTSNLENLLKFFLLHFWPHRGLYEHV